jgi:hypothetical protein
VKPLRRLPILVIIGVVAGVTAANAQTVYGPGGRYWIDGAYPGYLGCSPGPCAFPGETRRDLRRELREEALRRDATAAPPPSFDLPSQRPPPTPVEEIRPEYQGAGQIRDQYRRSGEAR